MHGFDWGFIVEEPAAWHVCVAEAWRKGTVGYVERFLQAWHMAAGAVPGIGSFGCLTLVSSVHPLPEGMRCWVGEVFLGQTLAHIAGRALEDDCDFPADVPRGF